MACPEVISLSSDSEPDEPHGSSPARAALAAFAPRQQKPVHIFAESDTLPHLGNTLQDRISADISLAALLKQEALNGSTYHAEPQNRSPLPVQSDNEAWRCARMEKAKKFQERRKLQDTRPGTLLNGQATRPSSDRAAGHGKLPVSRHEESEANDHTLHRHNLAGVLHSDITSSGTGQVSEPQLSRDNGLKRDLELINSPRLDPVPSKKPRVAAGRIGTMLEDVSEDSAPERITLSEEPELLAAIPIEHVRPPTPRLSAYSPLTTSCNGLSHGPNMHKMPWTAEEDQLLRRLKEDEGLGWDKIVSWFHGRTKGSLQVRYSTKIANGPLAISSTLETRAMRGNRQARETINDRVPSSNSNNRPRRNRTGGASAMDGFVSWSSLKIPVAEESANQVSTGSKETSSERELPKHRRLNPARTFLWTLRQRELGYTERRAWWSHRPITENVKNFAVVDYGLRQQYQGTSGDVVSLSWSTNGTHFAAGSIAITDSRSMQYNMQRNLLLGDHRRSELRELPEHHIPRPSIEDASNINGRSEMAASQDSRLFMTVSATGFSNSGHKLFTTGTDRMLRTYTVHENQYCAAECRYSVEHTASVDLLAVKAGDHDVVATGCHAASNSIAVIRCRRRKYEQRATFSPARSDAQSKVDIFPSALKWGVTAQYRDYLLAGFSGDEDKQQAGETCLWDVRRGHRVEMQAATHNVLDIAWNPLAGSASVSFAVAANPSGFAMSRGMRTAIHCFAPTQNGLRRIMAWECPAIDINDLVFCPYDDNLIAAGATDGNVYVWDVRSSKRSQQPLHTFHHGRSENVLASDRKLELADTGVRFLSWGATKSRLFSGSSDGIVKVWDPYRSPENAHVNDLQPLRQQVSAVMSGAFSPDFHDLLIGTENGQINQFRIGHRGTYRVDRFKVHAAPEPQQLGTDEPFVDARALLRARQIEIRPCGAMPLRQAVQGPNYSGPFLGPTESDFMQAEQARQRALCAQNEAVSNRVIEHPDGADHEDVIRANMKVQAAQLAIEDLNDRLGHLLMAEPKATAFQQALALAEADREILMGERPSEPCKLDCAVLPTQYEVEDSGRSEQRIPGALRSVCVDGAFARNQELDRVCISCLSSSGSSRAGKSSSPCPACKLKKAGLTATCAKCAGPMRVKSDQEEERLCESCAFSCFRCAGTVVMDSNVSTIYCPFCDLEWEAGVLGYQLVSKRPRQHQRNSKTQPSSVARDIGDEFGSPEIRHYASLWQGRD